MIWCSYSRVFEDLMFCEWFEALEGATHPLDATVYPKVTPSFNNEHVGNGNSFELCSTSLPYIMVGVWNKLCSIFESFQ